MRVSRNLSATILLMVLGACGAPPPDVPKIVAKAIDFHGGAIYASARITMTITSLSGSFHVETIREGGRFVHVVRNVAGPVERQVRLTNDTVEEWRDGVAVALDQESERRAKAFVAARVFFPLLPFTLDSADVRFEEHGLDMWNGYELEKVKVMFNAGTSNGANDNYMFWFDPDTGRLEQFGYDFGAGLRLRKPVEFNRIGGILFSNQDNYAIDGVDLMVDLLSPEYVADEMHLLSNVIISDITVEG